MDWLDLELSNDATDGSDDQGTVLVCVWESSNQ